MMSHDFQTKLSRCVANGNKETSDKMSMGFCHMTIPKRVKVIEMFAGQ